MPTIRTTSPRANGSSTRRKGSSPTASSKETQLISSGSNSSLVYPVPASISWLEQLTLTVTTTHSNDSDINKTQTSKKRSDLRYVLTVNHHRSKSTWSHARTFHEYKHFQKRLKSVIQHGHFCHAECPWLFTFVTSYFPKTCYLAHLVASSAVTEHRRETLQACLQTLQTFLAKKSNHCCSVVATAVADEVVAFINGDQGAAHQTRLGMAPVSPTASAASASGGCCSPITASQSTSTSRKSFGNDSNGSEDDESCVQVQVLGDGEDCFGMQEEQAICTLCQSRFEVEAYADSPSSGGGAVVVVPIISTRSHSHSARHLIPAPARPTSPSSSSPQPQESVPPVLELPVPPVRKLTHDGSIGGGSSRCHFYTTRLACGHRFHDECIVPKLNESMHCPTCGHEEKKA